MRIAILALSITSNDAVSNYVLSMHRALGKVGEVHIFCGGAGHWLSRPTNWIEQRLIERPGKIM